MLRTNLHRIRSGKGLSRSTLAAQCAETGRDLPLIAVRRIEEGRRRVDVDDFITLAVALQVTPTDLLIPGTFGEDTSYQATARLAIPAGRARAWLGGSLLTKPLTQLELSETIRWMPQWRARELARDWGTH